MNIQPPQVEDKLHVLEIPTLEDLQNLIANGTDPDNVRMFHYWMTQIDDYARRIQAPPVNRWDDAIFLGAIEWLWFLKELKQKDP